MNVVKVKKVDFGQLKALADVEIIEGVTVRGFKVVDGSNGLWVSMPSREFENKRTGKKDYFDVVKLDDESKLTLTAAVLKAYRA